MGANPLFGQKCPENYMKMKKNWTKRGWVQGTRASWIRQWLVHLNNYQWWIQDFLVQDPLGWYASLTLGSSIDQQNADIIKCGLSYQVIFIIHE